MPLGWDRGTGGMPVGCEVSPSRLFCGGMAARLSLRFGAGPSPERLTRLLEDLDDLEFSWR